MIPHPIRWLDHRLATMGTDNLLRTYGVALLTLVVNHHFLPLPVTELAAAAVTFTVTWRCRREAIRRDRHNLTTHPTQAR